MFKTIEAPNSAEVACLAIWPQQWIENPSNIGAIRNHRLRPADEHVALQTICDIRDFATPSLGGDFVCFPSPRPVT